MSLMWKGCEIPENDLSQSADLKLIKWNIQLIISLANVFTNDIIGVFVNLKRVVLKNSFEKYCALHEKVKKWINM